MSVTQKELKKEIKKLVGACVREADGFRASTSFAELKHKCKQNEASIDLLYRYLKAKLRSLQVEIRLCALNLVDEFFTRSHYFRTLLLDEFGQLIDCVLDVRIDSLLSDSRDAVRDLRKQAIRLLRKWQADFGSGYPQLANAFEYLRYSKRLVISDEDGTVTTRGDIRERLERERREEQIAMRKLASAQATFAEFASIMDDCRTELDSLMQIFRSSSSAASNSNAEQDSGADSFELVETEENCELVELFLRHRFKLENEYATKVQTVIRSLSTSLSYNNVAAFVRELIEKKHRIEESVRDAKNVRVLRDATRSRSSLSFDLAAQQRPRSTAEKLTSNDSELDDDDDDDDFVEVHQDGTIEEPRKPASQPLSEPCTSSAQPQPTEEAFEIDPETLLMLQRSAEQGEVVSRDGATKPKNINVSRREESAWVRCDSNEVELPSSFCADLQRCVFTFAGRFEPVTRCCNAPLTPWSPGDPEKPRLCPRRDRFKCPFHGLIVERDEFGRPTETAAATAAASTSEAATNCETDAAASAADSASTSTAIRDSFRDAITDAIRNDLNDHAQRLLEEHEVTRGRKRKFEPQETPKERLTAILLDPRSLQRVAQAEDSAIRARNNKRFAQQFNYSLS